MTDSHDVVADGIAPARTSPSSVLAPQVDPAARAAPVAPSAPTPSLEPLGEAMRGGAPRSVGVVILAVLAVFYTLHLARAFALPIVAAVLLSFLLSPVVRILQRARIPVPLGAALVVLALLATLGGGVYAVALPAQAWLARAPQTLATANRRLRTLRRPMDQVTRTAEQVAQATTGGTPPPARQVVVTAGPSVGSRLFGTTEALLAGLLEVFVLLYFLLAAGDLFLQKLIKVLPSLQDKRKAVGIARETEASISSYLFAIALINVGEGLVVAGVMWLIGMPNPPLWGVLAAVLELVPYLGAVTMVVVLALAGLTTFESTERALLVPASFLVVNLIQANLVTPVLLGRRLTLNPVAIFVGLSLWFYLWGIAGALLAVPLLATFKIFCDHIESLAPVGEFLGKADD